MTGSEKQFFTGSDRRAPTPFETTVLSHISQVDVRILELKNELSHVKRTANGNEKEVAELERRIEELEKVRTLFLEDYNRFKQHVELFMHDHANIPAEVKGLVRGKTLIQGGVILLMAVGSTLTFLMNDTVKATLRAFFGA